MLFTDFQFFQSTYRQSTTDNEKNVDVINFANVKK